MRRRGVVLFVVLVIISLLALVLASFVFFVQAETTGVSSYSDQQQARLAAISGLEELISVLRVERHNVKAWFDVPERFRHALVWGERYERDGDPVRQIGSRLEMFERDDAIAPAWRYSIVARQFDGPPDTVRYGITPESAKLNINAATPAQIEALLTPLLVELNIDNAPEMIAALLDWRDDDSELTNGGAENEYYNLLTPGYNAKNAPLDTVEELLLVRDFTAAVLYGEDVNRNGILDRNEDDGADSFPFYDNGDGVLNPGVAPFLTVLSRDLDTALDNKPRINLNGEAAAVAAQMGATLGEDELSPGSVAFITNLKQQNFDFSQLRSPAELYVGAGAAQSGEPSDEEPDDIPEPLRDSPITLEEVAVLLDRFSVRPADAAQQPIPGLINVNAAPARVLALVPGISADAAAAIVTTRLTLDGQALRTPAWLLIQGVLDPASFKQAAPLLTTKAYQYHVEALGYADHLQVARRIEWIIEMVGDLPQVKYTRDLTQFGPGWPVDDESIVVSTGR